MRVFSQSIFFGIILALGFSCEKENTTITDLDFTPFDTAIATSNLKVDNCTAGLICFPPLTIDTSCIDMQMDLDNVFYRPLANFGCIIPNFLLQIDQLWINGSTLGGLKVVSLLMPVDILPGTYTISANTAYDVRYVPSGDFNFLPDFGTLTITQHNMDERFIVGGFDFQASLISPPFTTIQVANGCFRANY